MNNQQTEMVISPLHEQSWPALWRDALGFSFGHQSRASRRAWPCNRPGAGQEAFWGFLSWLRNNYEIRFHQNCEKCVQNEQKLHKSYHECSLYVVFVASLQLRPWSCSKASLAPLRVDMVPMQSQGP